MSRISLEHVYKSFSKDNYVIKDFSLEIFDDEFLVLVGPSGCGKTTTLRMIAGLEELTRGDLYIDGKHQNDEDPSTRHLSFVFQNYALLPELTVYENINFGLLNKKMSKLDKRKRVEEIANKLSLYEKLGSYPQQLSGGQRQRVALARALVDNESLILFDEPLSNLDAVLREQMRSELIRLHKSFHMTCIYVTHDQIEAMAMASRIVLMKDGKMIQVGSPYQMYHDPAHLEVSTFMGSPDNNVLAFNVVDDQIYVNDKRIHFSKNIEKLIEKQSIQNGYVTIRPQVLKVSKTHKEGFVESRLQIVEHFGVNKLLHLEALGQTLRVIVDKDFSEENTMYLDFNTDTLLFDQNQYRVYDTYNTTIKSSYKPTHDTELQVMKELINYGYEVLYDESYNELTYDHQAKKFIYHRDGTKKEFKQFKDLLFELSYLKNHQD